MTAANRLVPAAPRPYITAMPALALAHHQPRRKVRLDTLVRQRSLANIAHTTAVLGD